MNLFLIFRSRIYDEDDKKVTGGLDSLKTLSEIEIIDSMPKTSSPDTEDTSHDTEKSPMDDTEKSTMNMEMSPVIEN